MSNNKRPHNTISDLLFGVKEWQSIRYSKKPRRMMLLFICIMNIVLLLLSSWIIGAFAINDDSPRTFFTAVYYTLTMILDAGCIDRIITEPGSCNIFLMIFCLVIIVISMITFTGALIGYITNLISNMIEEANTNTKKLVISDHIVILGWNTRASEMVNDLLYRPKMQKVVILVENGREAIENEIDERLEDTIRRENVLLKEKYSQLPYIKKKIQMQRHKLRNNVTYIIREGDIFSSVQLNNIQIKKAESIIILSNGIRGNECPAGIITSDTEKKNGDNRTIKTLMQVIDLTSQDSSNDNQKIVVEVENEWTEQLVEDIIRAKQKLGKCRVVPFRVHRVMGQLLSQFSLMPELNMAYSDLFSNKGATFYAIRREGNENSLDDMDHYLASHQNAIPLTTMRDELEDRSYSYYIAEEESDIESISNVPSVTCDMELNTDYWINEKHVLILGSNSKIKNVMNGFQSFCNEWTNAEHPTVLHVTVLDEEDKLKQFGYYREYAFVEKCISAEIFQQNMVLENITEFIDSNPNESSILILSDDMTKENDVDAKALTYLIYVKDIINRKKEELGNPDYNIDIVVEIIDPKHFDILKNYDVSNVVISNRYISKMITQISENYAIYSFYTDIMSYDDKDAAAYDSKEVYIKRAGDYFAKMPPDNTPAMDLIRTVFLKSKRIWGYEKDFAILLGYVDKQGTMHIFSGDQGKQRVSLVPDDKLILYSNH